jgi:hypothetical protein
MSHFIKAAKELVYPNGLTVTYTSVTTGAYDIESGSVTNTTTETVIKAFPKTLKTSQYSFPALIGKNASEWLVVAPDLPSTPKPLDKILKGAEVHTVETYSEHVAEGQVVLYKIIAVKG